MVQFLGIKIIVFVKKRNVDYTSLGVHVRSLSIKESRSTSRHQEPTTALTLAVVATGLFIICWLTFDFFILVTKPLGKKDDLFWNLFKMPYIKSTPIKRNLHCVQTKNPEA